MANLVLGTYSIQDSATRMIGRLEWDRLQPVFFLHHTKAEIPVIFSPMISL